MVSQYNWDSSTFKFISFVAWKFTKKEKKTVTVFIVTSLLMILCSMLYADCWPGRKFFTNSCYQHQHSKIHQFNPFSAVEWLLDKWWLFSFRTYYNCQLVNRLKFAIFCWWYGKILISFRNDHSGFVWN